jgi:hypothetical protein
LPAPTWPTEGAVVEEAAVVAREGHALRDALVDDLRADLCQPVHVGLAGAKIAALHRVVEEPVDAVAVVLVVLRGVDATLRGDAVRTPRAVLVAEAVDVVAELGERCGGRSPRQAGTHHDDVKLALVRRVDQLHLEAVFVPLLRQRTGRNTCVQCVHVHAHL